MSDGSICEPSSIEVVAPSGNMALAFENSLLSLCCVAKKRVKPDIYLRVPK